MIRLLHPLALSCVMLSPLKTASGQDKSSLNLSRDAAIQQAIRNNPELAVAALEIDRADSRLRWAGRLENPELELSGSTDQFGLNEDESELEIAFSQRFPVTSRLRDEKIVRKHDVRLAQLEFQIRRRQLAYEVDKAAIMLRAAERNGELQGNLLNLNKDIVTFLDGRAKVGEASSLDVTQANLNGQLLEQEVAAARAAVTAARSALQQLIGLEPDRTVTISDSLVLPSSAPPTSLDLNSILWKRPDYKILLASSDLSEAQLGLAKSKRWDDIAVKVFLASERAEDAPEGLERNTFAGVGISIPLPLRNRNQQGIEEARIDIEKAKRARTAKVYEIRSELAAALKAREAAHKLAQNASGAALDLAKKNFEEFKAAQQNGLASLLQVQQAQTQLLQLETSALESQKNYHLSEADVRFIGGSYPIPQPPASEEETNTKRQ